MVGESALENILKRDRMIVLFGLGGVIGLAWVYLVAFDGGMSAAPYALMPWNFSHFVLMFLMWAVMMVGMMLPSAAPMILLYMLVARKSAEKNTPIVATGVFVAGYTVAWTGFSLSASILQWGFELLALLSPKMVIANPFFGGGLLIAAGAYQWTPLKDRCLGNCRSPMAFLTHFWRDGGGGAFRMGLEHGLYCVGCCWVMMGWRRDEFAVDRRNYGICPARTTISHWHPGRAVQRFPADCQRVVGDRPRLISIISGPEAFLYSLRTYFAGLRPCSANFP